MKTKILIILIVFAFFFPIFSSAQNTTDPQAKIEQLKQQIAELQTQITKLQAQLIEVQKTKFQFTKTLYRGMKDDEIKTLQEFLKQYPDIYPEGLVTGYFGTLTEKAVRKLQEKYGIEAIGIVGSKTRQKINELYLVKPMPSTETAKPEEKPTPSEIEIKPEEKPIAIVCQNECYQTGSKKCSGNTHQVCGNYDTDDCLEWSASATCPANTVCQEGSCQQQRCSDGTLYGQCSPDKPKWCLGGNLADNCAKCSCPSDYKCQPTGNCQKIEIVCSDGTANNTCASVKPYFCNNGQLVADCSKCGCISATGSQCSASGECNPSCLAIQYSGNPADKLDIVFVPDKLTPAELPYFSSLAVPVYAGLTGKNGILKHEPFTSSKQKINIWALAVAEDFGCDWPWCHAEPAVNWTEEQRQGHEKLMAALNTCPGHDEVIIIRTSSRSAHSGDSVQGSGYAYVNYSRPGSYDNWTEATLNFWLNIWDNWANIVVHEIAHSFGRIGDEYAFNISSILPESMISGACDKAGCPQWCSGTSKMSYNEYAPECAQLATQETCEAAECVWVPKFTSVYPQANSYYGVCIARRSDKDNGLNCLSNTGCFEGCGGIATWWRSAASSIMTSQNPPSTFSGWHIKLLQDKLEKYR